MYESPKISIITISKNVVRTVERTLFSVAEQSYGGIEFIVIDGASTDGTLAVIERYRRHLAHFVSEPDAGIYAAMNKGIAAASGEFLLFLNAGDYLVNAASVGVAVSRMRNDKADVFYGNQLMYHEGSGCARLWRPQKRSALDWYSGSLPHASTFIRRDAFDRAGLYDDRYRIAGDYEWFVRAFKMGMTFRHIDVLVSVFGEGEGISTRPTGKALQDAEKQRVRDRHFTGAQRSLLKFGLFLRKNKLL